MAKLNPKKMKVAELKSELETRNIQVGKGLKKADLVAMLESALKDESGADLFSEEDGDQPSEINESDVAAEDDSVALAEDESAEDAPEQDQEEEEPFRLEEQPMQEEEMETPAEEEEQPEPAQEEEEQEQMQVDASPSEQISESNGTHEEMEAEKELQSPVTQEPDSTDDQPAPEDGSGAPAEQAEVVADSTSQEEEEQAKGDGEKSEDAPVEEQKSRKDDDRDRRRDRRDRDGRHDSHSRKRHHEDHDRHHRRYEDRYAPPPEEPEEEFDDTLVVLDKYNSDLNMKLHRDRLTGQPLTLEGFAYLWAGARATYGVNKGKVCYECKLTEEHSVRHLSSNEPNRHLVRLGWSRNLTTLMVGEEELSFAYCGTGKKVTNETAEDFGEAFKEGDVIGSYIDFTGDESVTMTFTKNGASLDVAFTVEKEKLGEQALFPHVLCKNTTVEFNFGQKETPYFPPPEGLEDYVFLAAVPLEERVRGLVGATERKQCQVIMMCGLPGSGKTCYVDNYVKENPDKNYSVLGTNALMKRMKVSGLESKSSRDSLMQHATNCLNRLFQVACRKKRNFILDQTNVYAAAQRRRMRSFEGFQRKAVIIVPSDEEFKNRVEKRKDQGKDIPDSAVYEMKMNFTFPEEGDLFEAVEYAELDKEEAAKVVEEYRNDAKKKGPPPEKRFRGGYDNNRGPMGGRGGWRGGYDNRMGGRPPFRGGGGGMGGGGYGGGGSFGRNFGGNQRSGGFRDGGRGDNRRGGDSGWNKGGQGGGGNWGQNRNMGGGRGGGFGGGNRGGYGGNRSGGGGGFNRNSGGGGNRQNQNRNMNQQNKGNFNQNRNQGGRGGNASGGPMGPGPMGGGGMGRGGGQQQGGNAFNYHQAYQQQAAQFSQQHNQGYQQQAYNPQAQQPDYSQQWAQYYQQQAAAQQQQAAAAAAYQNYYAYQNAYANQAAQAKPQ